MSGVINQRVNLGQGNGPDVELQVSGTAMYATYHTPDGFPVVYDDDLGLFAYAHLVDGQLTSTGVPIGSPPPPGVDRQAKEADEVRGRKISEREMHLDRSSKRPEEERQE